MPSDRMTEPLRGAAHGVGVSQNSGHKTLPRPLKSWCHTTMIIFGFISAVCLLVLIARSLKGFQMPTTQQSTSNASERLPPHRRRRMSKLSEAAIASQLAEHEKWKGAGGEFGLSADWRQALLRDDGSGGQSLRGEACLTDEKQAQVRDILQKRASTTKKVAACVRTKDFGRFLPEWIAFHYVTGIDEISVYDDNSADNTSEVLKPFIEAGIARLLPQNVGRHSLQMAPLNRCLYDHIDRHQSASETNAPTWITFHDEDEYLYPVNTSLTIVDALDTFKGKCCATVSRTQFGSSGYLETPRGLVLETYLRSKGQHEWVQHGIPKVMVNLNSTRPELGQVQPPMKSMHNVNGCGECLKASNRKDVRINHYVGSKGDFFDHTRHYWTDFNTGESYSPEAKFKVRDGNDQTNDIITHWACATREILHRIVQGLDLQMVV